MSGTNSDPIVSMLESNLLITDLQHPSASASDFGLHPSRVGPVIWAHQLLRPVGLSMWPALASGPQLVASPNLSKSRSLLQDCGRPM